MPTTSSICATDRARIVALAAALVGVAVCALASLAIGSRELSVAEVWNALTSPSHSDADAIVNGLRVPRTEVGLLVGAALGAAGALMQGLTRNPLAEPGILGVNAGAAFGVVLAIHLVGIAGVAGYVGFALIGGALAALLVVALGAGGPGGGTPIKLALAGTVVGALLVALTSAVLVFDAGTLDQFRFWLVGSIAGRDSGVALTVAPLVAVGLAIALLAGRSLNALALGEETARGLGQRVGVARFAVALAVVLLAGAAVAAAGPIAFLGLTVPHAARALVGSDYRWIVPLSTLLGAALLLGADVVGRVIARPEELQVGIVMALVGAPVFIWLVRRRRLVEL